MGIAFQKKIMTGLFGGRGLHHAEAGGDGWVFCHAGGSILQRSCSPARCCTSIPAASSPTCRASISTSCGAGNVKSMIFGGEGVFFAQLTGPGHVWLQSLPFSRLAADPRQRRRRRTGGRVDAGRARADARRRQLVMSAVGCDEASVDSTAESRKATAAASCATPPTGPMIPDNHEEGRDRGSETGQREQDHGSAPGFDPENARLGTGSAPVLWEAVGFACGLGRYPRRSTERI